jgi:hypothetical protein
MRRLSGRVAGFAFAAAVSVAGACWGLSPAYANTISDTLIFDGMPFTTSETGLVVPENDILLADVATAGFANLNSSPYVLIEPGNPTWISDIVGVCNISVCQLGQDVGALAVVSDSDTNPVDLTFLADFQGGHFQLTPHAHHAQPYVLSSVIAPST